MAAVLDSLASYVADMVIEMAKEEVAMLIGVSGEIENLGIKLRDLKNFLADADRRNITDDSVQGWVEELKCAIRIKTLNQKLDDIFKRGSSFNFIKLEAYQDRMVTRSQAVDRKMDPLLERSGVVGEKIEDDTRALVKVLTKEVADDSDSIMIVAIVGVGGIGKTTLSKKVFNDEAIQGKFAKKIWLSITQVFNEVELLRTAITAANGNLPGSGGGSRDKALLVPALADAVRDKKIFLVLDDMWGTSEWNNLLMAPFSHAAPNSRILVTTRHETVARGMKAKHPYHHVGKLGPENAWTLLKKQVLATEKSEPAIDMLKDIGLEIIEKCDGLPLAIKPKKTIIHDVQLVGMWIGEGFVHGDSDRLEELGIEYHKELILRILIEPDTSYAGQYICNMHDLKHLRYLALRECNDIKSLPENIHKMKFLQHISVAGCQNLVKLPDTIVKLQGLRYLELYGTSVSRLWGFHTHMDGDWCSLEELQPLSQLGEIGLASLENVSAASFATKARLSEKVYLSCMALYCKSRLGDDGLVKEEVSEQDQGTIMEVFDELYPPPYVQDIRIQGYFGRQLPKWMMSTATTPLNSLRILIFEDLACCIQLPNGLCQLPYLDYLEVNRAPAIKRVGPEFLQPYSHHHHASFQALAAFPRLNKMIFRKMVEWEEWDWEEDMQAMPVLEELIIHDCKRRIPLGLVSHARALKKLTIWSIKCLHSLENFASVVELDLYDLPELTSISNLPKLQKLAINCCPKLESLQEMTVLRRLVLTVFYNEKRLPLFMQTVKPSHLLLDCSPEVLASMAVGKSGVEWDMFSHIQHVEAYANDEGTEKRWHLFYTREPYKMETNVEANQQEAYEDDREDANEDEKRDGDEEDGDDEAWTRICPAHICSLSVLYWDLGFFLTRFNFPFPLMPNGNTDSLVQWWLLALTQIPLQCHKHLCAVIMVVCGESG
ncbi:disease resistance RPP13-like protein 4 [Triticum dicoccoides]|uniref:disease resistance RPP13-like protein 4 n=1 Tax=Triticum dicoccoides TaxID=85692 RepID=UPI00188E2DCB|nr:disease resistance RPP13-like protein 4 [Triticum dicoccoides]